MSRRLRLLRRALFATLALWLGLWPAADAVTGVSWIVIVEPATAEAGARCPLPADLIEQLAATGCCQAEDFPACAEAGCGEAERSRCRRCHALGGLVLFATAPWSPTDDRQVRGTAIPGCLDPSSRHLQPPVPPPWSFS